MAAESAEPLHVLDSEFEKVVLQNELPVLVDFWAPWCGPCRMVAPTLDKFAREFDGKLVIAKVNTDENPQWAQHYQVRGIPTMLFISKGQLIKQQTGALPEAMLRQSVTEFLSTIAAS